MSNYVVHPKFIVLYVNYSSINWGQKGLLLKTNENSACVAHMSQFSRPEVGVTAVGRCSG